MSFLESVLRELDAGRRVAAVSVVEQADSGPRHAGALMLVGVDGLVDGTIGGGQLEARAIEAARAVAAGGGARFLDMELRGEKADGPDMICGGSMKLFVEPLDPDSPTRVLFRRLRMARATGDDMFCVVPVAAPGRRRLCRLAQAGWPIPASLAGLVRERLGGRAAFLHPFVARDGELSFVVEPWMAPWRLVIAGGGHVARATSQLAAMVGFSVAVLDSRAEFSCRERFPWADLAKQVPAYDACYQGLNIDAKTFLAIMTHGHGFDRKVLVQAFATKAAYIGMIGSARKVKMLFAAMEKEDGVTPADLARVTVPIGLAIGAETPEEIAVSIVAQLVRVRAVKSGCLRHLPPEGAMQDMAGLPV